MTPAQAAAWAEASCAAQGVVVKVTDTATVAGVARVLRAGKPAQSRQAGTARSVSNPAPLRADGLIVT